MTTVQNTALNTDLGPFAIFRSAWTHRKLIYRLAVRDIESRYRGSMLGITWALLIPLLLLAVYTFVFSVIFEAKWGLKQESFALILFSGLILFNIFSECFNRAPSLMLSYSSYVKRVVFPLEILPWVILFCALFNALVSCVVFLIAYVVLGGHFSETFLYIPLITFPILLATLGVTLILTSLGVYLRDLQQFTGVMTMILMFMTPIFYPLTSLPEEIRNIVQWNPLAFAIEEIRSAIFWNTPPDLNHLTIFIVSSWLLAWFGYWWFMRTKKGFADVL